MKSRRHFLKIIAVSLHTVSLLSAGMYSDFSLAQNSIPNDLLRLIPSARLAGEGRLRMYGFHIYDAQLFVGTQGLYKQSITEVTGAQLGLNPFALNLRYARSFKGVEIAKRSRQEMEKLALSSRNEQQVWEAQLARLLPDVVDGTQITGVYLPNRGTLFLSQGKVLGEIAGSAFARSFFGIWLDPRTTSPDVRLSLLKAAGPLAN